MSIYSQWTIILDPYQPTWLVCWVAPGGPLGVPGSTVFRVFRILCASQRLTGSPVPWGPVGAMRLFVRDVVGQTLSLQVEGQVRDRGICPRDGHVGKPVL